MRDTNFHNIVRSVPLQTYTNAYVIVFEAASGLLEENFEEVGYRHIGVSMGSLKDANRILEQPSILKHRSKIQIVYWHNLIKSLITKIYLKPVIY